MTSKIDQAWAELKKLPEEDQQVAADAILDYVSGAHRLELSGEQIAEVERRLAEPNPKTLTITEFGHACVSSGYEACYPRVGVCRSGADLRLDCW